MTWSKVGGTLPSRFLPDGSLYSTEATLSTLEQADEGVYRCHGSNSVSSDVAKDLTLKVEGIYSIEQW